MDQADLVWRDTQAEDRMVQFARACRSSFLLATAESPGRAADLIRRATGRPLPVYDIREIFFVADEWLECSRCASISTVPTPGGPQVMKLSLL